MNELVNYLEQSFLKIKFKKNCHFLVGVSGGIDSVVLGHALSNLKLHYPFDLSFIYVDHQLNPESKYWATSVKKLAKKLSVEFIYEKVSLDQDLKLGIEGAARKLRYQAFHKYQKDILVLAHHGDDQLETLLLQLARGAGSKGLSCMSEYQHNTKIWRPFLGLDKEFINDYQRVCKLKFIQDPSNSDNKYDRNYLRNKVLPLVKKRFPQFTNTAGRSIKHIADSYNYQNAMAEELYKDVSESDNQLNGQKLKKLSDYEIGNVIRYWLNEHQILMPSVKVLGQIVSQVKKINLESQINIKVDGMCIRTYNNSLFLIENIEISLEKFVWKNQKKINFSDNTIIIISKKLGQGISYEALKTNKVEIDKPINMNAKLKIHPNQPARTLKYLFQKNNIPPWERKNYPVIYLNKKIICIPEIATDINFLCEGREAGLSFEIHKNIKLRL